MTSLPILTLLLLLPTIGLRAEETIDESTPAKAIASLTDPKKLATLKSERASNPRFQKCLYWLAVGGRVMNRNPMNDDWQGMNEIIVESSRLNKTFGTPYASRIKYSLLVGYIRAKEYGLFTSAGLEELKQGKSATITKGRYAGQEATADHAIPRSVCPELDNQIFNLRLLPSKFNSSKGDKVGEEQVKYAEELNKGGLLSAEGLEAVKSAYKKEVVLPSPPKGLASQESRDKAEEKNQARMDEEAKQMELEVVRAERKGTEAVYDVWVERLKKLGEQANKSKATSDVLTFEKNLNSAMSIWERMFEENWNKNHPRQGAGEDILKQRAYEMQRGQEVAHLESFLDASLRAN
jgi:hypothetical protein